jgi:hypothetical protein
LAAREQGRVAPSCPLGEGYGHYNCEERAEKKSCQGEGGSGEQNLLPWHTATGGVGCLQIKFHGPLPFPRNVVLDLHKLSELLSPSNSGKQSWA